MYSSSSALPQRRRDDATLQAMESRLARGKRPDLTGGGLSEKLRVVGGSTKERLTNASRAMSAFWETLLS